MTDSFVTQCPHCQTSFRVSHNQLSVARGMVRCGNCLQVFNAARQLLEQNAALQAALGQTPESIPAAQAAAVAPAPEVPPPVAEVTPAPVPVEPQPAAPQPEPEPAPQAEAELPPAPAEPDWSNVDVDLDHLDLDHELARLEQREPQPGKSFSATPRKEDSLSALRDDPRGDDALADGLFGNQAGEPDPEPEAAEPSIVEPPLQLERVEPPQEVLPGERTEPSLSFDLTPEPEPVRPLVADDRDDDEPLDTSTHLSAPHLSARDDEAEADDFDERREPALGAMRETTGTARKEALVDLVDDPLQLDWQKPRSSAGRRLMWIVLILLAAAALAGQYIWNHFDELARQDQYRPWFQQICPTLGCEVPSKVDISRIKSSNLVVRSHPDFKGALVVDAIIYNRAPFSQPFPLLELRFADLNGQLIASRRFKPSEYLSGELAGKSEMPSQTPIHIALDILDPGSTAVNYSLSFRSPE